MCKYFYGAIRIISTQLSTPWMNGSSNIYDWYSILQTQSDVSTVAISTFSQYPKPPLFSVEENCASWL